MNTIVHPSTGRGHADHGWLNAHHSFSFANWYDPARIQFGMLRVLNDDIVAAGEGFGMHPHNDMEIITIILSGALEHKDNMGNGSVIRPGDVQVMSAGTGVYHSEFNPSKEEATSLFQLWIFPKEKGIQPSYDQKSFSKEDRKNKIVAVASGFGKGDELYIHQNAMVSLGQLENEKSLEYAIAHPGNGAYLMVISGQLNVGGKILGKRDAVGITGVEKFNVSSQGNSEFLIIDVPMK
ncbi:MAG TPA: pirin family protein [Bacteroidia bacterium]|nr:pirin family protein [Bacteroidia bacterium]HNS13602.1 pirin family protein [Bacteroidia bacterium]